MTPRFIVSDQKDSNTNPSSFSPWSWLRGSCLRTTFYWSQSAPAPTPSAFCFASPTWLAVKSRACPGSLRLLDLLESVDSDSGPGPPCTHLLPSSALSLRYSIYAYSFALLHLRLVGLVLIVGLQLNPTSWPVNSSKVASRTLASSSLAVPIYLGSFPSRLSFRSARK